MSHENCPACACAAALNITDSVQVQLLHAMAASMVTQSDIINAATRIGFDLSDDVIDTMAECIDEVSQRTRRH